VLPQAPPPQYNPGGQILLRGERAGGGVGVTARHAASALWWPALGPRPPSMFRY
jgi:hypothetical protein